MEQEIQLLVIVPGLALRVVETTLLLGTMLVIKALMLRPLQNEMLQLELTLLVGELVQILLVKEIQPLVVSLC